MNSRTLAALAMGILTQQGCARAPDAPAGAEVAVTARASISASPALSSAAPQSAAPRADGPASAAREAPPAEGVDVAAYPWLADRTCAAQVIAEPLASRFAPPAGLARVPAAAGTFAAWLRGLPLRPKGPVLDYRGGVVCAETDTRVAAVIAIDEGKADLQQCADSIVRLHAEWQWSRGERGATYRAASGAAMPFARWLAGERPSTDDGKKLVWKASARASDRDDHGAFRKYLDAVFTWANTGALARDGAKVALADLRPGDFFVLPGGPGHAILVLDVAQSASGERALLLGQGYMPAQSFHVLRASGGSAWFTVDPAAGGVDTPFWPVPFPWSSLRRLD